MYMCVRGIYFAPDSMFSQEIDQSCICVLGDIYFAHVSMFSQEIEQSCICVLGISILPLFLCFPRRLSSHVYVC